MDENDHRAVAVAGGTINVRLQILALRSEGLIRESLRGRLIRWRDARQGQEERQEKNCAAEASLAEEAKRSGVHSANARAAGVQAQAANSSRKAGAPVSDPACARDSSSTTQARRLCRVVTIGCWHRSPRFESVHYSRSCSGPLSLK